MNYIINIKKKCIMPMTVGSVPPPPAPSSLNAFALQHVYYNTILNTGILAIRTQPLVLTHCTSLNRMWYGGGCHGTFSQCIYIIIYKNENVYLKTHLVYIFHGKACGISTWILHNKSVHGNEKEIFLSISSLFFFFGNELQSIWILDSDR